jgi:hypothetical protein
MGVIVWLWQKCHGLTKTVSNTVETPELLNWLPRKTREGKNANGRQDTRLLGIFSLRIYFEENYASNNQAIFAPIYQR